MERKFTARDLDLAVVRPDLPGRVSAVANGRRSRLLAHVALDRAPRVAVRHARRRALTGRGEVSHRDGNYGLRDVRVAPDHPTST